MGCKYLLHFSSEHHSTLNSTESMIKQINIMFTKLVSLHRIFSITGDWSEPERCNIARAHHFQKSLVSGQPSQFHYSLNFDFLRAHNIQTLCRCECIWCFFEMGKKCNKICALYIPSLWPEIPTASTKQNTNTHFLQNDLSTASLLLLFALDLSEASRDSRHRRRNNSSGAGGQAKKDSNSFKQVSSVQVKLVQGTFDHGFFRHWLKMISKRLG